MSGGDFGCFEWGGLRGYRLSFRHLYYAAISDLCSSELADAKTRSFSQLVGEKFGLGGVSKEVV